MHRVLGFLIALSALLFTAPAAQTIADLAGGPVTLQPGDVLKVEIWREEDLSGEFLVDEAGRVILPLLGEKQVESIPVPRLRDVLLEEYRVQLRNPSIIITPLRRVHVLGEVRQPGLYQVDPTVSLAGVVALAGGATGAGDLDRITVIRRGTDVRERASGESSLSTIGLRSGDQIFVGQRSWFERNSTFVVSALLSVTGLLITILR